MFCALAIGDNLTEDADRRVLEAFASRLAVDYVAWVDSMRVGGALGRLSILGLKLCP
jgi:hypothetical protein